MPDASVRKADRNVSVQNSSTYKRLAQCAFDLLDIPVVVRQLDARWRFAHLNWIQRVSTRRTLQDYVLNRVLRNFLKVSFRTIEKIVSDISFVQGLYYWNAGPHLAPLGFEFSSVNHLKDCNVFSEGQTVTQVTTLGQSY